VPDVALRPPTLEDVDAVVAVINRASRAQRGRDEVDADAVRGWWTQPAPFDLARDAVVAVRDGAIVGYGDIGDQAHDGTVLWLDIRGAAMPEVHAELERRALERRAPDGVVRAMAAQQDAEFAALLAGSGYRMIRSSYRMGIDLRDRTFVPVWPSGATVRPSVEGVDEPLLYRIGEESFADHWGHTTTPYEEWLHWLRSMGVGDPSLWFVAEVHGVPAGVAICRPYDHGDPDCGWVSVLGVLPEHRRLGLGTALYERAGMRVLWRWDIWERAG
jgi:hypothetical protein